MLERFCKCPKSDYPKEVCSIMRFFLICKIVHTTYVCSLRQSLGEQAAVLQTHTFVNLDNGSINKVCAKKVQKLFCGLK